MKAKVCDWLRDHWKLLVVMCVAVLFVVVSTSQPRYSYLPHYSYSTQVVMVAIVIGVCVEDDKNSCAT